MKNKSFFINSLSNIDAGWENFLSEENIEMLIQIENKIFETGKEYTPVVHKVLNFLNVSLKNAKIVILGQDPYPQKGVATGRAFEVGTLQSWDDKFNNISLKNIIRAIYNAYNNEFLKYSEIKKEIGNTFLLKPPYKLFSSWEQQGVILINTSFTCNIGESNSHEKLWNPFTQKLLNYISENNNALTWFIWGNNAKEITKNISIKNKIESMHPMMCYNKPERFNDFLFGEINPFEKTKSTINWLG